MNSNVDPGQRAHFRSPLKNDLVIFECCSKMQKKTIRSSTVVPNRTTFEYNYTVSSIRTNRATVFL